VTEETQLPAGVVSIEVKSPKTDRSIEFERDFGDSLEKASEMFGADVVHSIFVAQAIIRAQGAARTTLDNSDNSTDIAMEAGKSYTPGVARRGGGGKKKEDPYDILAKKVMSGEISQEDLMAELQKRMAG
jgi:hypothetical protein